MNILPGKPSWQTKEEEGEFRLIVEFHLVARISISTENSDASEADSLPQPVP